MVCLEEEFLFLFLGSFRCPFSFFHRTFLIIPAPLDMFFVQRPVEKDHPIFRLLAGRATMATSTTNAPGDRDRDATANTDMDTGPDSPAFRRLLADWRLAGSGGSASDKDRLQDHHNHERPPEIKRYTDCEYHNYYGRGISFCFDRRSSTGAGGSAGATGGGSGLRLGAVHLHRPTREDEDDKKEAANMATTATTTAKRKPKSKFQPFTLRPIVDRPYRADPMDSVDVKEAVDPDQDTLPYRLTEESTLRDVVEKFAPVEPVKGGASRVRGGGLPLWIRYPQYGVLVEFEGASWDDAHAPWTELTLFAPEPTPVDAPPPATAPPTTTTTATTTTGSPR